MLARHAHLSRVTVRVRERRWEREAGQILIIMLDPDRAVHMDLRRGEQQGITVTLGGPCLLTKNSALPDLSETNIHLESVSKDASKSKTADRILSTRLSAEWSHSGAIAASHLFSCAAAVKSAPSYFCKARQAALDALVDKFAGPAPGGKYSHSLQETAYAMGQNLLALGWTASQSQRPRALLSISPGKVWPGKLERGLPIDRS